MTVVLAAPDRLGPARRTFLAKERAEPWSADGATLIRSALDATRSMRCYGARVLATVQNPLLTDTDLAAQAGAALSLLARVIVRIPNGISHVVAQPAFLLWLPIAGDVPNVFVDAQLKVTDGGASSTTGDVEGFTLNIQDLMDQSPRGLDYGSTAVGAFVVWGRPVSVDVTTPIDHRGQDRFLELRFRTSSGFSWSPVGATFWSAARTDGTSIDPAQVVVGSNELLTHVQAAVEQANWCAGERLSPLAVVDADTLRGSAIASGIQFSGAAYSTKLDLLVRKTAETVKWELRLAANTVDGTGAPDPTTSGSVQFTLSSGGSTVATFAGGDGKTVLSPAPPTFDVSALGVGLYRVSVAAKINSGTGTGRIHQVTIYERPLAGGELGAPLDT